MEHFSKDLMRVLANSEPVLILNPDEQDMLSIWAHCQTVTLVSATGLREESEMIINQLRPLIEEGNVDYIFFGAGSSDDELIATIVNSLRLLMDKKITVVIPLGYSDGLEMRLDSRLFLYKLSSNEITVYESYKIR